MSLPLRCGKALIWTGFLLVLLSITEAQGQGETSSQLVVWNGAKPVGNTWAKLGPKGSIKSIAGAGLKEGNHGLVLRFDGDGWRGCGLNWKGWYPPDVGDDVSRYNALVFFIRQTTDLPDTNLTVSLVDSVKRPPGEPASNGVAVVPDGGLDKIDGTWRRVVLPLERFTQGKPLRLTKVWEIDFSNQGKDKPTFHIDQIGFSVEPRLAPRFAPAPPYRARVYLDATKVLHPISSGIYGVCGLPRPKLIEYGIPITRWGGNPSTRYNWRLGVDNGANDWFFKNRGQPLLRPTGTGYLAHIQGNQSFGATTYQTIPMIGWVAKDNHSYGFSVKKYGPQKATEPGHPDVGNGVRPDGSFVTGNDPHDTSVESTPASIEEAVRFVAEHAGPADNPGGRPGVKYWVLDNEPMLWHDTHRDVHPAPVSYEELWRRTVAYAEAIKRADPTAKVAGFCSWGWTDLFYSAADAGTDNYQRKADWLAHRRVGLAEWFLQKCAEYKRLHDGKALVDVFDVHWYPQGQVNGQGVYQGKGRDPQLNELRMRSPRDLWDAAYLPESWIRRADAHATVALLPRVKRWVAKRNPGMAICLGEYNFGGGDTITGGLAQAEVFGVMAREGLELAFIWYAPEGTQELAWKLYRSYDGRKGRFGDQYLQADSDQADLSVFAARRSQDGAVTLAVVNKNLHSPCTLSLDAGDLRGGLRVWRFDQETGAQVVESKGQATAFEGKAVLTLPAASTSMLVITPRVE